MLVVSSLNIIDILKWINTSPTPHSASSFHFINSMQGNRFSGCYIITAEASNDGFSFQQKTTTITITMTITKQWLTGKNNNFQTCSEHTIEMPKCDSIFNEVYVFFGHTEYIHAECKNQKSFGFSVRMSKFRSLQMTLSSHQLCD